MEGDREGTKGDKMKDHPLAPIHGSATVQVVGGVA